jgi:uncharacterized protein YceH (UPF0502 family)
LISAVEVRVLGSLIEKEATTPDSYPVSLNALTAACNQLSNRDPVMQLDENAVKYAVNSLRQQSLVRAIQTSGSRVMKFQHLATEKWSLEAGPRAVLCVLMLRGPQTLGEIRARTGRLAELPSLADVQQAMSDLAGRELAVELPRRPGQKEARYTHLLSGAPTEPIDAESGAAPTRPTSEPEDDRVTELQAAMDELRRELADLRARFEDFRNQFGDN